MTFDFTVRGAIIVTSQQSVPGLYMCNTSDGIWTSCTLSQVFEIVDECYPRISNRPRFKEELLPPRVQLQSRQYTHILCHKSL